MAFGHNELHRHLSVVIIIWMCCQFFRADISELIWLFDVVTYLVFCFLSIPFFFHCSILPLRGSFSFSIHRWLIPQHRYASFKRLGILIYSFLFSVYFCFFFLLRHRFLFHFVEAINVNICRYYEADVCLNINTRSVCCCVSISRLSSLRLSIYISMHNAVHMLLSFAHFTFLWEFFFSALFSSLSSIFGFWISVACWLRSILPFFSSVERLVSNCFVIVLCRCQPYEWAPPITMLLFISHLCFFHSRYCPR